MLWTCWGWMGWLCWAWKAQVQYTVFPCWCPVCSLISRAVPVYVGWEFSLGYIGKTNCFPYFGMTRWLLETPPPSLNNIGSQTYSESAWLSLVEGALTSWLLSLSSSRAVIVSGVGGSYYAVMVRTRGAAIGYTTLDRHRTCGLRMVLPSTFFTCGAVCAGTSPLPGWQREKRHRDLQSPLYKQKDRNVAQG